MAKSKYIKLTQIDHILLRPDTYIGSINTEKNNMFVMNDITLTDIKVVKKEVGYNPGFLKIFDEILSNASDASIRTGKVKTIKINIDSEKVSVENDGPSIPVVMHTEENIYNSELIFSHLLTGENYDDNEQRFVSGKNGYGAKLCNVFSTKFVVDNCDGKKKFKQIVKSNMKDIGTPVIKDVDNINPYTKITYYPEVSRFGLTEITSDIMSLMMKRCLDIAVYNPKVRVVVNGKTLPVKTVKDYMKMHLNDGADLFYEKLDSGWEIGIAKSTDDVFEQVSIVNGTYTYRGGTHVSYIANQLSKDVCDKFNKNVRASWADVKNKMFLFVISQIPNPEFDTQTKENLTNYMSKEITGGFNVGESTVKKIMKSEIVESIIQEMEAKESARLKRLQKANQKVKVEKLVDANSKDRSRTQLFIFEGECLEENTKIKIVRDDSILDVDIKDTQIDDMVITHKNRFRPITSINRKIGKSTTLKTSNGDLVCSQEHKWFVYDNLKEEFYFIKTKDLDKTKHKLVKNYLSMMKSFSKVLEISKLSDDSRFDYILQLSNCVDVKMTSEHKTACYDTDSDKFIMVKTEDIDKNIHLVLNIDK